MKLPAPRGRSLHDSRGQIFAFLAAILAVIGGMTALAVDLGTYMADRRDLQNAADAIALAASQDLPSHSGAQAAADAWATNNGIDPDSMTVTIIDQNGTAEPNPKVQVELDREHGFVFAPIIGLNSATVSAKATAIRSAPAGGNGVVPLSVTQETVENATFGEVLVLKYDAQDIVEGNTGPLRIDGPGAGNCTSGDKYCAALRYGSENVVCVMGSDPAACEGPAQVDTEPGNKVGPTRTALTNRLEDTDLRCDEFSEVLEDDPKTDDAATFRLKQSCNPFLSGGYDSERIMIIPVIEQLCNGSCTVTIVDFALFYFEGFENPSSCTGNECEVLGRFVRVNQNVGLLAGVFDDEATNLFVKLVE